MTKPEPFLLQPAGKDYLWGGNRLHTLFGKQLPLHPLAETWECSTHPDGCSIVASGIDKGKTLAEVLQQHPEFLGTKTSATGDLPVLIKLIDAAKDLSVQVHPDDAYAQQYEHEPNGKTEMWYILEAEPGASLIYAARTAGHLFKRKYDFVLSSENPCEKGRCLPDTCRNGARHWSRHCIGRNSAELQPHLSAL